MNKRRSESSNRRKVYLGHPFATLPSTNMLKINQHTTKLSKALLTAGLLGGAAVATLGAGSAQAVDRFDCRFGASTSIHPLCTSIDWVTGWDLEDKKLTNLVLGPAFQAGGPPSGDFSFLYDDLGAPGFSPEDMWQTLITFDPDIPDPLTGSYSYDLAVTAPGFAFDSVSLSVIQTGSTKVKKEVVGSTNVILEAIGAMPDGPEPISGTSIKVTDSWEITPAMGTIDAINNTYKQVPAPLPLLGVGAAFGSIRKLRKFSTRLKTFSMN